VEQVTSSLAQSRMEEKKRREEQREEQIQDTEEQIQDTEEQIQREEQIQDNLYCTKYERKSQLSNGVFSSVYSVKLRGKLNKQLYAAKYLGAHTEAARREVDILTRLRKCNQVVRFVEVFHCEYHTILVTEFLQGSDLFERVSSSDYKLTEQKCQIFVRQILQGLQYIHSLNIVHLDIKPFNIIFSDKNTDFGLKLLDFSLSQDLGSHKTTAGGKMQGTIEYMAPEVINCQPASTASDMWSAGVVVYMLLSGGVSPFYQGSRPRTLSRALSCQYDLSIPELSHTSPEALDLVRCLLVKDPDTRLTATECLASTWLSGADVVIDLLHELETTWMRKCLARRRWYRALNALKAMHTMRKLTFPETVPDSDCVSSLVSMTMAPTRVAVLGEGLAEPKDFQEFKDKYETEAQVGAGAFGSVYRVRERETGDLAAAKYLRQEKDKVREEAAVLRSLIQSAFVVQLLGLFESPLHSVLVTEYLGGGDLITRTASTTFCLTERKCQVFIRQIVRGLLFIHSQRIIHLDLKPFNIMFANPEDDYNLRIIDFGLAENLGPKEEVKMTMCGTLEFMSPEVMDCKFASPASDMWGVGVITYMLVSGGLSPFWGGNRYRTMAKTLSCEFTMDLPNFSHISDHAKDFISQLLILDSKSRRTAAQCLAHPWLTDSRVYVEVLHTLQTAWMKSILARRRWHRWYHAITALTRMRRLQTEERR